MADFDTKIKNVIKDTVKSRSIKKESLIIDPALYEIDDSLEEEIPQPAVEFYSSSQKQSSTSSKRRQPETVDLRSPTQQQRRKKKPDSRQPFIHPQGLQIIFTTLNINRDC